MSHITQRHEGMNRVEVIDHTGRAYAFWSDTAEVTTSIQDGGRTLKVFISDPAKTQSSEGKENG